MFHDRKSEVWENWKKIAVWKVNHWVQIDKLRPKCWESLTSTQVHMKWPRRTKTNRFNSIPNRSKLPVPKSTTLQIEAISEGGKKGTSLWTNPSSADQNEEGERGARRSSQIAMDSAARRNGGGLFEGLYRVIMRRNSVYVTFIIAGAFLGERVSCKILGFVITNSYFVRSFF